MKNMRFFHFSAYITGALMFCVFFTISAKADFAQRLNYQGRLIDSDGIPLPDGSYGVTFEICTDSACTAVVWTEVHAAVDFVDGLFSDILGGSTALSTIDFNATEYYLRVSIGGTFYSPNQRLTATAMALNVRDSAITSAKVLDNSLTAADFLVNVVSSVDGVVNDGGDVDFVGTGNITITPDDALNKVTFDVSVSSIDHGSITGLGDDDHPQYFALAQNETVAGIPAFNGGASGVSAPFSVDSTFLVTNLNADMLDGYHSASFILDGCADCLNATEIEDIYVLNTSDTMSGSLGVGTTLSVGTNLTVTGTVDSGQGATEIYLMNQNLRTSDSVTHVNITSTGNFFGDIGVDDTRAVNDAPTAFDKEVSFDFKGRATVGVGGSGTYSGMMTFAPWGDNSGDASYQLNFNEGGVFWRQGQPDAATWDTWYQLGYSENLDDRFVNITGDTMTGELIAPSLVLPAAGYSSGAVLDVGNTAVDYPANAGWPVTYNANILLSGQDSTSIAFHDSGISVGTIRYINDNFYIGEATSWGPSSLTVGSDLRAGGGIRAGATSDVTDGSIAATGWIGAGCEANCETAGGYAILYGDGTSVQTSTNKATSFIDYDNAARYVDPSGLTYLNRIVSVDNTTMVTNLNADMIDGVHGKATGNFGQWENHGTYSDCNASISQWGWNFVQGATNCPNATSSQWYRGSFSLGANYPSPHGDYSLELAFPRTNATAAGVWLRTYEGGSPTAWNRIDGTCYFTGSFAVNGTVASCGAGYCANSIVNDTTKMVMASGDYSQRGVTQFATARLECCKCNITYP